MMHQTVASILRWLNNKHQVRHVLSDPLSPDPVMLLMTLLGFFCSKIRSDKRYCSIVIYYERYLNRQL